jgi:hypothetical protein
VGGDIRFAPVDDFPTSEGLELALFVGTSWGWLSFSFCLLRSFAGGSKADVKREDRQFKRTFADSAAEVDEKQS